ncbi:MAG: DUF1232 domain-containing protein [Desulfomonile tiedjei]|nr:DUF1232 domain-containing protein [Desulfomonile tiedjei]
MSLSFREVACTLRKRLAYYQAVYRHPDTPWMSKALLWLAVAYALSPVDIIPDFIPVVGHLDDLVVVPALIVLAIWMVPNHVIRDCRSVAASCRVT